MPGVVGERVGNTILEVRPTLEGSNQLYRPGNRSLSPRGQSVVARRVRTVHQSAAVPQVTALRRFPFFLNFLIFHKSKKY